MKLTPEQEFLKALAKHFDIDIESLPFTNKRELRIVQEARKYLKSFEAEETDTVEPTWTPEVGKLCRDEYGIYEITDTASGYRLKNILDGSFYDQPMTSEALIREYTPIAELEGLKVEDSVYTPTDCQPIKYLIKLVIGNTLVIRTELYNLEFAIDVYGKTDFILPNKQLFWRTADRAERFGRVE